MASVEKQPSANPFSTRFVRPGAIPYLFPPGESAAHVTERLARLGWWAQMVGPHGVGKSTLVAALVESLRQAGRAACVLALVDRQRRLPAHWADRAHHAAAGTIVVDGYEQLSRWSRWRLKARCRREGWGLLVTAHDDVGFPTLVRLVPRVAVARAVVARLLPAGRATVTDEVTDDVIDQCFRSSGGNLRETLFALYDHCERQRDGAPTAPLG